jgi:hypothetical protein
MYNKIMARKTQIFQKIVLEFDLKIAFLNLLVWAPNLVQFNQNILIILIDRKLA